MIKWERQSRLSHRRDGFVEHAAQGRTINVTWLNTKSDDPTCKLIRDDRHIRNVL
jgi:hypothetical protein